MKLPNLFGKLFSGQPPQVTKGPYLGVDIGTVSVKIVEIDMRGGKPTVVNYGMIESPDYLERVNGVVQTSSLNVADGNAADMIRTLLAQMGTRTRDAAVAIPSFSAFSSVIDLPAMTTEETAQAVPYQARSLVPLPMSDVTIDWTPIGQFEDSAGTKKQRVFLISVPNEQINAHRDVCKRAGLNLKMLEVEGLSIARSLTYGDKEDSLLFDIGAFTSTVAVAGQGILKYSVQTDFASNSLTQSLAKGLGINAKRAEALKRQRGLSGMTGEYGLSTLMTPFIDVILNEGIKAKNVFEGGGGKISKIILSGGGGSTQSLVDYAGRQFGLPAERANPWGSVSYSPEFAPLLQSVATRFAVAVGVGIKPFIG
ncbi:MAG: type IV pilus assembly protein PilM [Parcubacteria group bacterium]